MSLAWLPFLSVLLSQPWWCGVSFTILEMQAIYILVTKRSRTIGPYSEVCLAQVSSAWLITKFSSPLHPVVVISRILGWDMLFSRPSFRNRGMSWPSKRTCLSCLVSKTKKLKLTLIYDCGESQCQRLGFPVQGPCQEIKRSVFSG